MGRKLDLSGLSEAEAKHVLQVVQRDMSLREKEEARLSEMKQELDAEGSRCTLLSRQHRFNERCCIRCCAPFTFLLNPKRPCLDCQYNVCKSCRTYSSRDKAWLCSACQKTRQLKTQSLEWYYNNVRRRFKRFGSAKVLKTLYRKHVAEQGQLEELTEESTYAVSTGNEGSVCDSDSAFYKQIEEHNMADTITVALRVAEEAIDEAITKAEAYSDNREKQKEAQYLRENREELIEELATTIVHKIIRRRRDLSDTQPDYNLEWPPDQDGELLTCVPESHSTLISSSSLKSSLWRSRSAFSLLTDGTRDPYREAQNNVDGPAKLPLHGLKKDGMPLLPSWKSVDRLDNSSTSTVLQSQDGNWIALQSTLLSRPSLLVKRKSLVFSVLEKESDVVSAYDEMGSDTEMEPDGARGALLEFRRKMKTEGNGNADGSPADSDVDSAPRKTGTDGARLRHHKPLLSLLKTDTLQQHRRTPSRRPSVIDMNFNPDAAADSSEADEPQRETPTRRRRRRSRREHLDDSDQMSPYASSVPEYSTLPMDDLVRMHNMMMQQTPVVLTHEDRISSGTDTPDILSSGNITPELFGPDPKDIIYKAKQTSNVSGTIEKGLTSRLQQLANKVTEFSSTEDELDRDCSKVDWEEGSSEESEAGSRESRLCVAQEALWAMEAEGGEDSGAQGERHIGGDRLAEMDIDMEEVKEEGEKYIHSVRSKVLDHETQIQMANTCGHTGAASKEHTWWWESLDNLFGGNQERRPNARGSEFEYDSLSEGLEDGGSIDAILDDMVRSSEIEIEKSRESWERVEDMIEAMDVGEENVRTMEEVERKKRRQMEDVTFTGRFNTALSGKQRGRVGSVGSETAKGKHGKMYSTAAKGEGKYDSRRMLPSAWQRGDWSEPEDKGRKSYSEKKVFNSEERINKEYEYKGVYQGNAKPCVKQQGLLGRGQGQDREASEVAEQDSSYEVDEHDESFTFWAEEARQDGSEASEKSSLEEWREKMEVKVNQRFRREDIFPRENKIDTSGEEERGSLKMATVSGKVAVDGGVRAFLDESSSSDPNPYPSPDDINKKYSAASLRSITTEMLRVLNATEELIQGAEGSIQEPVKPPGRPSPRFSPGESKKLDEQLSKLEENVYVAASAVYGLEGELSDLEACARRIGQTTSERELAHLEDQVASAAAQVQQSELKVTGIAARIAALKTAGLNVAPQTRLFKPMTPMSRTQTLDTSRQQRRRLPAPPTKEKETADI